MTSRFAARLRETNLRVAQRYPGDSSARQPVHTVYGGAHLFTANVSRKAGDAAIRTVDEYAPDFVSFAKAIGMPGSAELPSDPFQVARLRSRLEQSEASGTSTDAERLAFTVYQRVREKLQREPIEDFRIDFEDGYGNRPDAEEDGHAIAAAEQVSEGIQAGALPPFTGIRIKPLTEELRERSLRTLDIFITTLVKHAGGQLSPHFITNFFVTLPKVTAPEQISALVEVFELLEKATGLPDGSLRMEFMVETPQSIFNDRGASSLPRFLDAAGGRCAGAHFGTYDYTASLGITAAHQRMTHPACDFARHMMQVAFAGTGVWLSDGATNILPVPVHRGDNLTREQSDENRRALHRAWALHFSDVQHSLVNGYYQGWDLHPAQLPTRYAAVYAFFFESMNAASERLRTFIARAAQATLVGDVMDDAATGQALLNFFLRAFNCGAITAAEAQALSGLSLPELRLGSFARILQSRATGAGS
jgi:citrate lyase beta subunit